MNATISRLLLLIAVLFVIAIAFKVGTATAQSTLKPCPSDRVSAETD